MGSPYRAPQNLPKPPPDPMRTVLVVTGAIAAIGAALVLGIGFWDAHRASADTAKAASSTAAKPGAPPVHVAPSSLVGLCHDGWCWEDPLPTGDDLVDVVAKVDDTWIAAVHPTGSTLLHWNGASFTSVDVQRHVTALARAGSTIWAATREGAVLESHGAAFTEASPASSVPLASIWASSDTDAWAVGDAGTILHGDGKRWGVVASPSKAALEAVRGQNAKDVWASGDGVILHFDGSAWSVAHAVDEGPMKQSPPEPGGFCGNPAMAVKMANAALVRVDAIMPLGPKDVWFGAGMGRMIHWNGTTWSESSLKMSSIDAMWSSSPKDAWAVGSNRVAHWNGSEWALEERPFRESLRAVHGSSPNDVWAVGKLGRIRHWDGETWSDVDRGTRAEINTLWVGPNVAMAGGEGALLLRDASGWHRAQSPFQPKDRVNAIGGASTSDLWAFAAFRAPMHFDGKTWSEVEAPQNLAVFSIAAPASDDVWAWGALSLAHWDGSHWTNMSDGEYAIEDLWAPAKGTAYATARPRDKNETPRPRARHGGFVEGHRYDYSKVVLVRWDGKKWARVDTVTGLGIGGLAPDDIWLAGADVTRSDHGKWLTMFATGDAMSHRRIDVMSASDVWVSGQGDVRHWDGATVHTELVPMTNPSLVVAAHDVFGFSMYGGIVHRAR